MTSPSYDTISFLSDYGRTDEFVGVVHSVVRQLAPGTVVIDVTHDVPAHDVRAGGLALARSAQYLAPGVVLAVVDPGVGSARRAVAIEVGDGESVFIGPDNGLLAPAVAMVGGATRAVELTNVAYQLGAPGPTFAGRDVFAPAAAHLCAGVALLDLGVEVDTAGLMPATIPITRVEEDVLYAEVLWTDRYGNLQLNVDPAEVEAHGDRIELRFGGKVRTGVRHHTYAEVPTGEIGLVVDSYGLISIAVDRASAAEELRLDTGDEVALVALPDDGPQPGRSTPVTLREKHR
ncbi:SAM-dependent chlorinase/fluorinase [Aquihabitans sp. G128]|uniref:SAM hydrolase/SAM-dependent halogenase family protein n=1 Tax=Aquihabitans sp. G128 TaxID=2849779 RepID=UPI001C2302B5|nr:SAM-dependent chlorinase/fluorinase [Aquihabitans sp. G128]QXC60135.1 SAM-dependent chlorinase/fluorinase [Aquihabitans sp. G128]